AGRGALVGVGGPGSPCFWPGRRPREGGAPPPRPAETRSEGDVGFAPAATTRGRSAHRGRAVKVVVRRVARWLLPGLLGRLARRLLHPRRALGPLGPRLKVLEGLDDDAQLTALAAAVLVLPRIELQPALDEQLLALADRLQQASRLLPLLATVPDLAVDEDRLVFPLLRLLVELA